MKKFIFTLFIIFLICISACNNKPTNSTPNNDTTLNSKDIEDMNNDCKLIINGNDVSLGSRISINYQEKYAKLPLCSIAKSLGCDIKQYNKNKIVLTFKDNVYILNQTNHTLKKKGDNFNIIALPPGTNHSGYYQIHENEIIIDSDSMRHFINLLGAKIIIDYDSGIINISR